MLSALWGIGIEISKCNSVVILHLKLAFFSKQQNKIKRQREEARVTSYMYIWNICMCSKVVFIEWKLDDLNADDL